jgi:hypothetical protein
MAWQVSGVAGSLRLLFSSVCFAPCCRRAPQWTEGMDFLAFHVPSCPLRLARRSAEPAVISRLTGHFIVSVMLACMVSLGRVPSRAFLFGRRVGGLALPDGIFPPTTPPTHTPSGMCLVPFTRLSVNEADREFLPSPAHDSAAGTAAAHRCDSWLDGNHGTADDLSNAVAADATDTLGTRECVF